MIMSVICRTAYHMPHTVSSTHCNQCSSVVTKALDVETETKTEAAGSETESKTKAVASETEAKTEAVYLETETEAHMQYVGPT